MRESHNIIAAQVGARLKVLRGGETQQDYAKRLGLSQAQYNRYETGKRLAPDNVLQRAAQAAGITPEQLIWGGAAAGPSSEPAGPSALGYGRAVAQLVELMDSDSQEDLFFYLKAKTQDLQRRQARMRTALEDLEAALKKAV